MAATKSDLDIASRVPSKVWEQIFQHVSVLQLLELRLTCRSWRTIVDGCPALMKRIWLKFPQGFVLDRDYTPKYLVPVRNLSLEKIRISAVDSWWPAFGERIVKLNVDDCELSLRKLLEILKSMKRLKVLQLNKLRMLKCPTAEANFKLSKVEKFTINTNASVVLDVLVPVFTRLRWISLPKHLNEKIFINLVHTLKDTLEGITIDYTETMLKEILQLKQLTRLIIRTGIISNQALTEIGNALPKLNCLTAEIADEKTSLTFLNTFKVLENISIEGKTRNQKLDFGESKNPKLTSFQLSFFYSASTNLHKYLYHSTNIVNLVFCNCKFDSWFIVFATLELYCLTLQRLELQLVEVVKEDDYLSEYFDSLKYLKIHSCAISKKLLIKLISLCPRLEEIHLESMNSNLDDEVILVLSQKLQHLEKLTLIGNRLITDTSADYIVRHCHALGKLTVRHCCKLNDVAKNKLKNLNYVRCLVE